MRYRGLTLVEVLAVVALLGLMAAATAWSMADDVARSNRQAIVTQIGYADRMARIAADRLGGACTLRIDLDHQRLQRVMRSASGDEQASHTVKMTGGYRVDRVRLPGESVDAGEVEIAYATGGRSVSYAVRLSSDRQRSHEWLVFAGLSGQMVRIHDEQEVDNLFEKLATGWPDAD